MAPKIQWPLVLFSLFAGVGGCAFAFAGVANALGEMSGVTNAVTVVAFVLVCGWIVLGRTSGNAEKRMGGRYSYSVVLGNIR